VTRGEGKPTEVRRPVVLLRCSTEHQDTDFLAQRADVQAYLDAHGLEVAPDDWREEAGVHGDAERRPVLDKIREEAAAGAVSHVIAADFDRLGRAGEETLWIVRQLVDVCKVEVVIARHPTVDLRTLQGRLMLFALAMAGLCKLDTVQRSTSAAFTKVNGVTVARRSGKKCGTPGFVWTPEQDAELLRLRHVEKMSPEAIAEACVLSVLRGGVPRFPKASALRDRLKALCVDPAGAGPPSAP
jgi:DNA invertase Pin-like site-specific DNA recombinase